ncbi:MAG: hypothetical protein M1839_002590 [Geoglossum umbratile]|nr:MAG: hypothetical protein M1839_002590 [Geoglossum umbratile]
MSASSTFTIGLSHTGDTDASYRLQRRPGEIQHVHLIQDESELSVQADLFSVLHGTYTPGGDAASLVVIDFRFTGSDPRRKRLREATIDVQFALENEKSGSRLDPEVIRIAPNGMFKMDPSVQQTSTKLSTNAMVSGGGGPMTLGIAGGWEKTKSMDEESWAAMSGRPRIEGRIDGSYNAAIWKLRENSQQKHGIPSILRVAVLLVPKSTAKFRAFVRIDTAVDLLSSAQQRLKNFLGGVVVDPVYFDDEGKRKPLGPKPANVDVNNLSACDLGNLSYDGPGGPSPPIGSEFCLAF